MKLNVAILCCVAGIVSLVAAAPATADEPNPGVALVDPDRLLAGVNLQGGGTTCEATLTVGTGSGIPGSTGNMVPITLTNNEALSSISLVVTEMPDDVTAEDCTTPVRGFDCQLTNNGASASVLLSAAADDLLPIGAGVTAINLLYGVSETANMTVQLGADNVMIVTGDQDTCELVTAMAGSFAILECDTNDDCDDGLFCTGMEACVEGLCEDGALPCDPATQVCLEDTTECVDVECAVDDDCDDGLFCTGMEACVEGLCEDGALPCDPATQVCLEDTTECVDVGCAVDDDCDDGLFCTGMEACVEGLCEDGALPCDPATQVCLEDTDECVDVECAVDDDCDDGMFCTGVEACVEGLCEDGALPCDPATQVCLEDTTECVDVECAVDDDCDDGLFCTGMEACVEGLCEDGALPCDPATQVCLEDTDECVDVDCAVDDDCDDGLFCTGMEACVEGLCEDGALPCDPATQVCLEDTDECVDVECTVDDDCDDGLFCTGMEACVEGLCEDGALPCDPATQVCLEDTDECVDVDCTADDDCDDGLFCTGMEACVEGLCEDGALPCDPATQVCLEDTDECVDVECAVDDDCDDGLFCTGMEACVEGLCEDGTPPCDPATQVCLEDNDECVDVDCTADDDCDDMLFCNGSETCVEGFCQDGTPPCTEGQVCDEDIDECVTEECTEDADCDDNDICTDDFCDNGICSNEFNPGNDPSCVILEPSLASTTSCAFSVGSAEICFDFMQPTNGGFSGNDVDGITAIDWCITWDDEQLQFDCSDEDMNGIPDDVQFLVDGDFTTAVECTPEDPTCRVRFSILDLSLPFELLPDGTLACAQLSILPAEADESIPVPFGESSASDTQGNSVALATDEDSFIVDGCCLADCNSDDRVDIADAVSVILELSDQDGADFCDVQNDVPFDGSPCCDCNADLRVDIADAVCVVNGIGDLQCPAMAPETEASLATTSLAAEGDASQSNSDGTSSNVARGNRKRGGRLARQGAGLALSQRVEGDFLVVPVVFSQGLDDGRPGGLDELTAFSACIDFDQERLALDPADLDGNGVPDAIAMRLPQSHSSFVQVNLDRADCELHLGVIDFSAPSQVLPAGIVAEIEFQRLGDAATRGTLVRPGSAETLSFSDVNGVSQRGKARAAGRVRAGASSPSGEE